MDTYQKREQARIRRESIEAIGTFLRPSEASRVLHVHENTLKRWGKLGMIKVYRIGPRRDRRFKEEDIAVFLAEQRKQYQAKQAS
jgi:excisionase family DNA binding protein